MSRIGRATLLRSRESEDVANWEGDAPAEPRIANRRSGSAGASPSRYPIFIRKGEPRSWWLNSSPRGGGFKLNLIRFFMGSTVTSPSSAEQRSQSVPTVRYTVWPLRDEGRWAWFVVAVAVGAVAIVQMVTGAWHLATLTLFALLITLRQFLLPTHYQWDRSGIQWSFLGRVRSVPWTAVAGLEQRGDGLNVAVAVRRRRRAEIQRLDVPWGQKRADLMAFLAVLPEPVALDATLASTISAVPRSQAPAWERTAREAPASPGEL